MNLVFLSILLIQVATNALPAISLSISTRGDPESRKTVINGKEYTATPLPKDFQGPGQTFKLEGGFQVGGKLVPAILKRVLEKEGGDDENSRTVQEIKFLKKPSVGLHLFSQWSETGTDELPYQADIVIKDLREQDPPLKPFHEWYQEDKRIHGPVGLRILYQNLEERLIWYAEHKNLFVGDVNMKNVFVEKKYVTDNITELDPEAKGFPIMPTFWEPADADVYGIDDISYENDQAGLMKAYKDFLSSVLEQRFSVEVLAENLKPDGELRSVDMRRERFRGKTYDLLQIKIESPSTTLYKIVGGFEFENRNGEMTNVPALMTIRTPERGEDEDRGRPTQGGRHLGAEERKGLFLNVYTDGRSRQ